MGVDLQYSKNKTKTQKIKDEEGGGGGGGGGGEEPVTFVIGRQNEPPELDPSITTPCSERW